MLERRNEVQADRAAGGRCRGGWKESDDAMDGRWDDVKGKAVVVVDLHRGQDAGLWLLLSESQLWYVMNYQIW